MLVGAATPRWDVLVVGAGSAGCVLAARLAQDPDRHVLLIESGSPAPEFEAGAVSNATSIPTLPRDTTPEELDPTLWHYPATAATRSGRPLRIIRGRLVGGSGAINGASFLRGLPYDYDAWSIPAWSFASVLGCFRRMESDPDFDGPFHGSHGPVPIERVARAGWPLEQELFYEAVQRHGFRESADLNDPQRSGIGPIPRNTRAGLRISMATAYLEPALARTNLELLDNATVARVRFTSTRAVGVEVDVDGERQVIGADKIILCAGAIESAHLLLRSGIGPGADLAELGIPVVAERPGVGVGMHEHPYLELQLQATRPSPPPTMVSSRHHATLFFTSTTAGEPNDLQVTAPMQAGGIAAVESMGALRMGIMLNRPASRGLLRLRPDGQGGSRLALDYRHLAEAIDRGRLREAVGLADDLVDPSWARITDPDRSTRHDVDMIDRWIDRELLSSYHTSGTCRLGRAGDPLAVVDSDCSVFGVEGLFIADLSIAPNVVSASTNATAVMIAERASELIPN